VYDLIMMNDSIAAVQALKNSAAALYDRSYHAPDEQSKAHFRAVARHLSGPMARKAARAFTPVYPSAAKVSRLLKALRKCDPAAAFSLRQATGI
jgi:hypothetical protein